MEQHDHLDWLAANVLALLAACVAFFVFPGALSTASAQNPSGNSLLSQGLPVPPGGIAATNGDWSGQYMCAQGVTGAQLIVSDDGSRALFHFFPLPENPGVLEGCFSMSGSFKTSSSRLYLNAGQWIVRPPNYITVNFSGSLSNT